MIKNNKIRSSKLNGFLLFFTHNTVVSVVESERIELSSKQVTK
jgi:hypothetical protein